MGDGTFPARREFSALRGRAALEAREGTPEEVDGGPQEDEDEHRPRPPGGTEWRAVGLLLPYLLEYKGRVAGALVFLAAAKLANVGVPLVMKQVVDGLDARTAIVAR